MKYPLVSVIIPVFNGECYLGAAIESALAQDYRPIEVILVDDGSTDRTASIARSYPDVRYLFQENQGVSSAKNTGIGSARGEFVAFLDHDDTWPDCKLTKQVAYLRGHPEIGCVFGGHTIVLEKGTSLPSWMRPGSMMEQGGKFAATMLVRRHLFELIGLFDPTYRVGEDTDWISRATDGGVRTATLPDLVLYRRVHESNISALVDVHHQTLTRILRSSVARKRLKANNTGDNGSLDAGSE